MGKGRGHFLLEMLQSVFVLKMLSKVSVDEVFMHYVRKCQLLGAKPQTPPGSAPGPRWGTSVQGV